MNKVTVWAKKLAKLLATAIDNVLLGAWIWDRLGLRGYTVLLRTVYCSFFTLYPGALLLPELLTYSIELVRNYCDSQPLNSACNLSTGDVIGISPYAALASIFGTFWVWFSFFRSEFSSKYQMVLESLRSEILERRPREFLKIRDSNLIDVDDRVLAWADHCLDCRFIDHPRFQREINIICALVAKLPDERKQDIAATYSSLRSELSDHERLAAGSKQAESILSRFHDTQPHPLEEAISKILSEQQKTTNSILELAGAVKSSVEARMKNELNAAGE